MPHGRPFSQDVRNALRRMQQNRITDPEASRMTGIHLRTLQRIFQVNAEDERRRTRSAPGRKRLLDDGDVRVRCYLLLAFLLLFSDAAAMFPVSHGPYHTRRSRLSR